MKRRTLLLGVPATVLIMNQAEGAFGAPAGAGGPGGPRGDLGRFDRPQSGFSSARTVLTESRPEQAGLDPKPLEKAWQSVVGYTRTQPSGHPLYPGAVLTYSHQGHTVLTRATGYSRLYADTLPDVADYYELPEAERIRTRTDTIYDMASVSKLFTSIVIMQLVEKGLVDLDQKVAHYLPEFVQPGDQYNGGGDNTGKDAVTIRMLLTHTSGFPAFLAFWRDYPDPAARMRGVLTATLVNPPGSTYLYSDLNLITLGEMAHRLTGLTLDRLVAERITRPLRMRDTGYNPDASLKRRIAATEEETVPARGVVWGQVHDENSWSFDGVAGHAGVFSTARDMSILAQTMLNGGSYRGERILSERSVQQMITNENTEFPGDDHGLGFELNQRWYMGGLAGPRTAGHTGYTGTSIVIDFDSRSFVILLTNRVHPSRNWGSINPARVAAAQGLAEALAVRPVRGRTAWFSGTANASTSTLTWTFAPTPQGASLDYQTFVDTESSDTLTLTASTDGQTFTDLPYTLAGTAVTGAFAQSGVRRWQRVRADLPVGTVALRWTYVSDTSLSGRGVYVDDLEIRAGRRVVVDGERNRGFTATGGWAPASR